jgi:hypothetical protein
MPPPIANLSQDYLYALAPVGSDQLLEHGLGQRGTVQPLVGIELIGAEEHPIRSHSSKAGLGQAADQCLTDAA